VAHIRAWSVPSLGVLALSLTLVACGGGGSHGSVNMGTARTEIMYRVSHHWPNLTVGEVRCPAEVPLEKGRAFFCTVQLDGVPLRLVLRETNGQGATRIGRVESVLFPRQLEAFVANYANEHRRPVAGVSCGKAPVLTEVPGKTVSCVITWADGTKGKAVIGVKNTTDDYVLVSVTR
jgi:hypothetical protein